jgi:serine protease Do
MAPGSEVTLTVLRDNKEQKIRATLAEFSPETAKAGEENNSAPKELGGGKLGVSVEPLTPELAQQLGLRPGSQGVVVDAVDSTGAAVAAGIQRGDVIQEVNRQTIRSAADLSAAIDKNGSKPALLLLNRRGEPVYLTVRPR